MTAAGLIAGKKILGMGSKIHVVGVSDEMFVNPKTIANNCNNAIDFLVESDPSFPNVQVSENDFEILSGYLGSEYGVKTQRSQEAVDLVNQLEGKTLGFQVETTYTGKAMAGLLDFLRREENKDRTILFWNTYNSNDLDEILRETDFNYEDLPKRVQQFYEKKFQCWQVKDCPEEKRLSCDAYLNHEYRCWLVKKCHEKERKSCKAFQQLSDAIELEDA